VRNIAIIQTANAHGRHSLALAQALQFEVSLRQKDIIGEWVPQSEPGVSDILNGNKKWLYGIRWDGLDNLVLHHTTSWEQKEIAIDLRNKMLVMTELTRPGIRKASGAIIVDEDVKRPYDANKFRKLWREIATEAGVPKDVRNMDSYDRSYGAASEHQETKVMK
jgi:hypothetical protein